MKIIVLGAGAWGTAVAMSAAQHPAGHAVTLWARDAAQAQSMRTEAQNTRYLPGIAFPDGLTVFDAYGQWLFRGDASPNRLRTNVLVVLHEDTQQRRADIEAIRLAWKQQTKHQSVLWSRQPVEVSF